MIRKLIAMWKRWRATPKCEWCGERKPREKMIKDLIWHFCDEECHAADWQSRQW